MIYQHLDDKDINKQIGDNITRVLLCNANYKGRRSQQDSSKYTLSTTKIAESLLLLTPMESARYPLNTVSQWLKNTNLIPMNVITKLSYLCSVSSAELSGMSDSPTLVTTAPVDLTQYDYKAGDTIHLLNHNAQILGVAAGHMYVTWNKDYVLAVEEKGKDTMSYYKYIAAYENEQGEIINTEELTAFDIESIQYRVQLPQLQLANTWPQGQRIVEQPLKRA